MEDLPYKPQNGKFYLIINNYPYPVKQSAVPALIDVNAPVFGFTIQKQTLPIVPSAVRNALLTD